MCYTRGLLGKDVLHPCSLSKRRITTVLAHSGLRINASPQREVHLHIVGVTKSIHDHPTALLCPAIGVQLFEYHVGHVA